LFDHFFPLAANVLVLNAAKAEPLKSWNNAGFIAI